MENEALYIDLTSIIKAEGAILEINKEYPQSAFFEVDNSLPISSDVLLKGNVTNLSGSLFLKGTLYFSMKHQCDRCLEDFDKKYSVEIEEVIAKDDVGYEANEYIPYSGSKVLLIEGIYKCIFPITLEKHLCSDECKGLCTRCGCNLNFTTCDCKDDELDPRLEKLKDFFKS